MAAMDACNPVLPSLFFLRLKRMTPLPAIYAAEIKPLPVGGAADAAETARRQSRNIAQSAPINKVLQLVGRMRPT